MTGKGGFVIYNAFECIIAGRLASALMATASLTNSSPTHGNVILCFAAPRTQSTVYVWMLLHCHRILPPGGVRSGFPTKNSLPGQRSRRIALRLRPVIRRRSGCCARGCICDASDRRQGRLAFLHSGSGRNSANGKSSIPEAEESQVRSEGRALPGRLCKTEVKSGGDGDAWRRAGEFLQTGDLSCQNAG